jgi:hypothetical protein
MYITRCHSPILLLHAFLNVLLNEEFCYLRSYKFEF